MTSLILASIALLLGVWLVGNGILSFLDGDSRRILPISFYYYYYYFYYY